MPEVSVASSPVSHNASSTGGVHLYQAKGNVAIVVLGDEKEKVVTLTKERMLQLRVVLAQVKDSNASAVLFTGPRADMFSVGADVKLIESVIEVKEGVALARLGQTIIDQITSFPFPSFAGISGPCVGGAFELALACSYRLCSDHPSTLVGLPEVNLGIIPGFGGTQRLPRLIGLPAALDLILSGKTIKSSEALKMGLVDEVLNVDGFLDRVTALIKSAGSLRQPFNLKTRFLTYNRIGRSLVKKNALSTLSRKVKGPYRAPYVALECALYGLEYGVPLGLEKEAKEVGDLIVDPITKSLIHVFSCSESAKALARLGKFSSDTRFRIIGAGTMGSGIATALVRAGFATELDDVDPAMVSRAKERVITSIQQSRSLAEADKSRAISRISVVSPLQEGADSAHVRPAMMIEAIVEDLTIKKEVFKKTVPLLENGAILATNTSSLSITDLASDLPDPERVIGVHFFNPAEKLPLVEIVRGERTSDQVVFACAALTVKLGKFPIIVEDSPGFLVNRILTPYLNAAGHLAVLGYPLQDIDAVATDFGLPMGPFRLLDEIGLDVAFHVGKTMEKGFGARMTPSPLVERLLQKDRKGRKTGEGFYDYPDGAKAQPFSGALRTLEILATPRSVKGEEELIRTMLIGSLISEASRAFDEGVAGAPSLDAAKQIDLGSVMGFGFPSFRGGVLFYANSLGAKVVAESCERAHQRFPSCPSFYDGINERSKRDLSFFTPFTFAIHNVE